MPQLQVNFGLLPNHEIQFPGSVSVQDHRSWKRAADLAKNLEIESANSQLSDTDFTFGLSLSPDDTEKVVTDQIIHKSQGGFTVLPAIP
jgi:hypothetical protein